MQNIPGILWVAGIRLVNTVKAIPLRHRREAHTLLTMLPTEAICTSAFLRPPPRLVINQPEKRHQPLKVARIIPRYHKG